MSMINSKTDNMGYTTHLDKFRKTQQHLEILPWDSSRWMGER